MIDENFCAKLLKKNLGKEWKLLGGLLADVKNRLVLKLQSWFEKNLIICLQWNDQYDKRMVVILDGGDLIGVIVIRVLI